MGGGLLQELDHLLVCEVVQEVELEGVLDGGHAWGVDGDGEEVPHSLHQLLRDKGVPLVVLLAPLVQGGYLGSDNGGGDGAHPRAVVGDPRGQGGEHLRVRHSEVRPCRRQRTRRTWPPPQRRPSVGNAPLPLLIIF